MKYYDPKKVQLIIAGLTITGFAEGDKIKIEPVTKDDMKSFAGIDGDVTYAKVNDDRYNVTFTLSEESPSNKILDAMRKVPTGVPVMIKNTSAGKYLGGGTDCRIMEKPSITFGPDSPKREWKVLVPNYSDVALPE